MSRKNVAVITMHSKSGSEVSFFVTNHSRFNIYEYTHSGHYQDGKPARYICVDDGVHLRTDHDGFHGKGGWLFDSRIYELRDVVKAFEAAYNSLD